MHQRFGKIAAVLLMSALLAACSSGSGSGRGGSDKTGAGAVEPDCREVQFAVQVLASAQTLHALLCTPASEVPQSAVVLVHGSTYDRAYWDFPVEPSTYSASRILAGHGHLTLTIDRLGSGASSRPPSKRVTPGVSADALHQVVAQLKRDTTMETRSGKVFLVGHSSGSALSIREAAQYKDVDGVVVTGFIHHAGPGGALFPAMTHLAAEDVTFSDDSSIPHGYTTTQPGVRSIFYYPLNVAEEVLVADEETKDAMPGIDSSGFVEELTTGSLARSLAIPVLSIVGTHDLLFCTPPNCPEVNDEKDFYSASPDVEVIIRPKTGHNLNLHRDALETTNIIGDWLGRQAAA